MAETFAQFDAPVLDTRGVSYTTKVCGRERDDGLWEGWIEFENTLTGQTLRTFRETTQPNSQDMTYWASGLTAVYLEGALDRARAGAPVQVDASERAFDEPVGWPEA